VDSERENDREELVELLFLSEYMLLFPGVESTPCLASGRMGGLWHEHLSWEASAKGPQWGSLSVFPASHRQDRGGGLRLPLTQ